MLAESGFSLRRDDDDRGDEGKEERSLHIYDITYTIEYHML